MKKLFKASLLSIYAILLIAGCAQRSFQSNMYTPPYTITDNHEASEANYNAGMKFYLGVGTAQDYQQALTYFYTASRYGNAYAENQIGYMYSAGLGVPRNYALALQWYQRSGEHGLASAQYTLGVMYSKGIGTPMNRDIARMWFIKAAQRDFIPARNALRRL